MNPSETVASPVAPRSPGAIDYQQFGGRQFPADRKWALGLQVSWHAFLRNSFLKRHWPMQSLK